MVENHWDRSLLILKRSTDVTSLSSPYNKVNWSKQSSFKVSLISRYPLTQFGNLTRSARIKMQLLVGNSSNSKLNLFQMGYSFFLTGKQLWEALYQSGKERKLLGRMVTFHHHRTLDHCVGVVSLANRPEFGDNTYSQNDYSVIDQGRRVFRPHKNRSKLQLSV